MSSYSPDPLPLDAASTLKDSSASVLRVPGVRGEFYCRARAGSAEFSKGVGVTRALGVRYALDRFGPPFKLSLRELAVLEQVRAGERPFGAVLPGQSDYRYYRLTSVGVEPCESATTSWAMRRVWADSLWAVLKRSTPRLLVLPLVICAVLYTLLQWVPANPQYPTGVYALLRTELVSGAGSSPWWYAAFALVTAPWWVHALLGLLLELRVGRQPSVELVRR